MKGTPQFNQHATHAHIGNSVLSPLLSTLHEEVYRCHTCTWEKRYFAVFRLMFNAPEWPFRMDWALESPVLIGLCIQCWNQNKLAIERLSAFNKSASNITHSTIAAQNLACVGIRFTVQCENSAYVLRIITCSQYAAVP